MTTQQHSSDVHALVQRILTDTSACHDDRLRLVNVPAETRQRVIELLRGQDMPVLATDSACGPG